MSLKHKLSPLQCTHAKGKEKPYHLSDGHGLYLRVMPNGSRYWRYDYKYLDKAKTLAIGVFPEIGLAAAREKHMAARELLRQGKNPIAVKRENKQLAILQSKETFELIAEEWFSLMHKKWAERHKGNVRARLRNDIYPALGAIPIRDITSQKILALIRYIEQKPAPETARRTLKHIRQIFVFAKAYGYCSGDNPTNDLHRLLENYQKGHFAAIDAKGIPALLNDVNRHDARLTHQTRLAIKLLMLTFVRTRELVEATWDEIDFNTATWHIPAARMKKRRDHIVPLSQQTIAMLTELKKMAGVNKWVFPNRGRSTKPMSDCTIINALNRMGYQGRMTGHGFRALAMSTIKEVFGTRHEVIDRQLAHVPNKINKAYDRAEFLSERRVMMQDWADYIDRMADTRDKGSCPALKV